MRIVWHQGVEFPVVPDIVLGSEELFHQNPFRGENRWIRTVNFHLFLFGTFHPSSCQFSEEIVSSTELIIEVTAAEAFYSVFFLSRNVKSRVRTELCHL